MIGRTIALTSQLSRLPLVFRACRPINLSHSPRHVLAPPVMQALLRPGYSTLPTNNAPPTLRERLRTFFRQYGKLGIGIYLGMSLVSFSSIYLALRTGVDVKALIRKIGLPDSGLWDNAGTVAVAYAIHKIFMPVRLFLTVALTTFVAKRTRFGRGRP